MEGLGHDPDFLRKLQRTHSSSLSLPYNIYVFNTIIKGWGGNFKMFYFFKPTVCLVLYKKLKASDDGWNDEMIKRGSIPMMLLYGIAIICTLLHLSLSYFGFDVGSGGRVFFF